MRLFRLESTKTVFVMAMFACVAFSSDDSGSWDQWLGPNRNGILANSKPPLPWGENGPKVLWRKPLGEGVSSISVSGDKAVTMFGLGSDEFVVCLSVKDGSELWRVHSGDNFQEPHANGPRSTPTINENRVFALSAGGMLYALDLASGKKLWTVHLKETFDGKGPSDGGYAMAPLVDGNRLLVEIGGSEGKALAAFDKKTGKVLWNVESVKSGFSSPILADLNGQSQVIFFSGSGLISLSPKTGKTFWQYPWETEYDVNAVTPLLVDGNRVFISSAYGVGSAMLLMESSGKDIHVKEVWRHKHFKNHYATSILYNGFLYGFDNSTFSCIDAAKGDLQWKTRDIPKGSLLGVGGRLIVLTEKGELILAQPNSDGVKVLAKAKVLEPNCYTVPAISEGKLFVRNLEEIAVLKLDM